MSNPVIKVIVCQKTIGYSHMVNGYIHHVRDIVLADDGIYYTCKRDFQVDYGYVAVEARPHHFKPVTSETDWRIVREWELKRVEE